MRVYEDERDKLNDSAAIAGNGIVFPVITCHEEDEEEEETDGMQFSDRRTVRQSLDERESGCLNRVNALLSIPESSDYETGPREKHSQSSSSDSSNPLQVSATSVGGMAGAAEADLKPSPQKGSSS